MPSNIKSPFSCKPINQISLESPRCIFRADEPVFRHRASLSLSLFPLCLWAEPAIRSHAMCSLSSMGAQLFAGGTHARARMNDWHSGDLPGRQPTAGMELSAVLGRGVTARCCVICLQQTCCLRGPKAAKYFRSTKGQLGDWYS